MSVSFMDGGWTHDAFGLSLTLLEGMLVLKLGSHGDVVLMKTWSSVLRLERVKVARWEVDLMVFGSCVERSEPGKGRGVRCWLSGE